MPRSIPSAPRYRVFHDDETTRNVTFSQVGSWGYNGTWTQQCTEFTGLKTMTDRLNPIGIGGFRSPGPLSALVVSGGMPPQTHFTQNEWVNGEVQQSTYSGFWPLLSFPKKDLLDYLPTLPSNILTTQRTAAWNKFMQQVPEVINIGTFALELLEMDSIFKSFAEHRKTLRPVSKQLDNTRAKNAAKHLPSWANSTFLSWNFQWAPFIGDLQKLSSLMDRVAKRLDFLRRTRGKPTPVHYYAPDCWESIPTGKVWSKDNIGGGNEQHRKLELVGARFDFSARCILVQDLIGLDDAWASLRAVFSAAGINNPAMIVWNKIPFSFMVDWMLPVQELLKNLAVKPFAGRWDIYDANYTIKSSLLYRDSYYGLSHVPGGETITFNTTRNINVDRVERKLGLPLTMEDAHFADLKPFQQQLFLSLLAGNTLFRERRHKA